MLYYSHHGAVKPSWRIQIARSKGVAGCQARIRTVTARIDRMRASEPDDIQAAGALSKSRTLTRCIGIALEQPTLWQYGGGNEIFLGQHRQRWLRGELVSKPAPMYLPAPAACTETTKPRC